MNFSRHRQVFGYPSHFNMLVSASVILVAALLVATENFVGAILAYTLVLKRVLALLPPVSSTLYVPR